MMSPFLSSSAIVSFAVLAGILSVPSVGADRVRPVRGALGVSVFLCKFKGEDAPPNNPEHYIDLFFGRFKESLGDYWYELSSSSVEAGGPVLGWYEVPSTYAEADFVWRQEQTMSECIAKVKEETGYAPPKDHVTVVVTYPGLGWWMMPGTVGQVYAAWNDTIGEFQHKIAGALGLGPSFTNDSSHCYFDRADRGAYGDL
jgi:hypothetical protein